MTQARTFRKKPVEIRAIQFDRNYDEVAEFMGYPSGSLPPFSRDENGTPRVALTTVHGDTAYARPGDWIIPEAAPGQFYPCAPDVFAATYEQVSS